MSTRTNAPVETVPAAPEAVTRTEPVTDLAVLNGQLATAEADLRTALGSGDLPTAQVALALADQLRARIGELTPVKAAKANAPTFTRDDALQVMAARIKASLAAIVVVPEDAAALGVTVEDTVPMARAIIESYDNLIGRGYVTLTDLAGRARTATPDSEKTYEAMASVIRRSVTRTGRKAASQKGSVGAYVIARMADLPAGKSHTVAVITGPESSPVEVDGYSPSRGAIGAWSASKVGTEQATAAGITIEERPLRFTRKASAS